MAEHASIGIHSFYCAVLSMFFLQDIKATNNHRIVVFYDESLNLSIPKQTVELWIHSTIEDALFSCIPKPSIHFTNASKDGLTSETSQLNLDDVMNNTTAAIAFTADCETRNMLIQYFQSLKGQWNIVFVDFFNCSPLLADIYYHVEAFRLEGLVDFNCLQNAIHQWIMLTVCMDASQHTLNYLIMDSYSPSLDFEDCGIDVSTGYRYTASPNFLSISPEIAKRNLNGNVLRFGSFMRPPFVTLENRSDGSTIMTGGFCFEIMSALKTLYNFTYNVLPPTPLGTGTASINGTWNGIVGLLQRNECDLGVGPFSVTYDRKQAIDFTISFYEEPTSILIPPPKEESQLFTCAKPFQFEVWIGLICVVIFLPPIIWFYSKLTLTMFPNKKAIDRNSLIKQYNFVLGTITSQSGQTKSCLVIGLATLILSILWCLISVVFIHAYIGTLISFLSFPKLRPIVNSLEDVPKSGLHWSARRGTDLESLFTKAEGGIYKEIGDGLRHRPNSLLNDSSSGPDLVREGNSVYITGKSFAEFVIDKNFRSSGKCLLHLAKEEFYKVNQAFALPKGSLYGSLFNKKILQMIESGLTEYWRKRLWPSLHHCDHNQRNRIHSLTLKEIQSAFLILAVGCSIASLTFFIEVVFYKIEVLFTFRTT